MHYGQKSTSALNEHHNPIYTSEVNTQPYFYTNLMIQSKGGELHLQCFIFAIS